MYRVDKRDRMSMVSYVWWDGFGTMASSPRLRLCHPHADSIHFSMSLFSTAIEARFAFAQYGL